MRIGLGMPVLMLWRWSVTAKAKPTNIIGRILDDFRTGIGRELGGSWAAVGQQAEPKGLHPPLNPTGKDPEPPAP